MKTYDKELLLKDLCGRVSYNPKFIFGNNVYTLDGIVERVNAEGVWVYCLHAKGIEPIEIELCRPYLFPMSSMTEEQHKSFDGVFLPNGHVVASDLGIDYLNSIHVDYRGLIPMGLALDATDKDIY